MSMERSERSAYVGVHVRPEVKSALRELVDTMDEPSVSALLSGWIEEKLTALGVSFQREVDPRERPLPFEDAS